MTYLSCLVDKGSVGVDDGKTSIVQTSVASCHHSTVGGWRNQNLSVCLIHTQLGVLNCACSTIGIKENHRLLVGLGLWGVSKGGQRVSNPSNKIQIYSHV